MVSQWAEYGVCVVCIRGVTSQVLIAAVRPMLLLGCMLSACSCSYIGQTLLRHATCLHGDTMLRMIS